jgi:hypothetical protein
MRDTFFFSFSVTVRDINVVCVDSLIRWIVYHVTESQQSVFDVIEVFYTCSHKLVAHGKIEANNRYSN